MTTRELPFLDSIQTERQRRLEGRTVPDPHAHELWALALELHKSPADENRLRAAHEYALGISYRHGSLSSDVYVAHPLRVAAMALLCRATRGPDVGVVGLLHNVLEVSGVGEDELRARFGDDVGAQVAGLTVNRSRQWDSTYKQAYYETLNGGPTAPRIVKVFDKLDNLYLLGLNSDVSLKTRYAEEIRTHILPMVRRDVPALHSYLTALLNETILAEKLQMPMA